MADSSSKEFYYQASGQALSGTITRPTATNIEAQASVTLPTTGGTARAEVLNLNVPNILSFDSATSHVAGSVNPDDGSYNTLVTIEVTGFNVLNTVTADRLILKISAKHLPDDDEGQIIPLGSSIENLRVAGVPVVVNFDHELFNEYPTLTSFTNQYTSDSAFRARVRPQFLWGDLPDDTPDFIKQRFAWHTDPGTPPESKGVLPCNLVKSIQHDQPNLLKTYGNMIIVPQFGKVIIGDAVLRNGQRSFSLLRLELGSPVAGVISSPTGATGGANYP